MDKRNSVLESVVRGAFMKRAAEAIVKSADKPAEPIIEVPHAGGSFASHKLEQDYEMKHPEMAIFHPGIYGGAATGALLGRALENRVGVMTGALVGGMAGSALEAMHRYNYLRQAKEKLERGESPIDPRYQV